MDHGGGNHGGMDHGGMDHGGGGADGQCSMKMLWNADVVDTCIVFESWHIRSTFTFFLSCLVVCLLGVFYEYLRLRSRRLDRQTASKLIASSAQRPISRRTASLAEGSDGLGSVVVSGLSGGLGPESRRGGSRSHSPGELGPTLSDREDSSLLGPKWRDGSGKRKAPVVPPHLQVLRSLLYGVTVFVSFMLMLVAMTFNVYLILSICLGAVIGHYAFARDLVEHDAEGNLVEATSDGRNVCH